MATYIATYSAVAFAAGKNMGALLNQHASEKLDVTRIWIRNASATVVTGVACNPQVRVYRSTAGLAAPTAVTPVAYRSTDALPTSYVAGHAGTLSGTSAVLRNLWWSSDEPVVGAATVDEMETIVPFGLIWDGGYADSTLDKLRNGQNELTCVYNVSGAAASSTLDTEIEFIKV